MSRHKTYGSKRVQPEIGLFMECEDEPLNSSQKDYYGKIRKDYQNFTKKMDAYVDKMNGQIIVSEGDCFLFEIKHGANGGNRTNGDDEAVIISENIRATAGGNSAGRLYTAPPVQGSGKRGRPRKNALLSPPILPSPPLPDTRGARTSRTGSPPPPVATPVAAATNILRKNSKTVGGTARPCEITAVGGLTVGAKVPRSAALVVGGVESDTLQSIPGKAGGKTYPSLTIVTRPCLLLKPSLVTQGQTERVNLDAQVKGVLMYTPAKFTEWLIQQGLVRSEHHCKTHLSSSRTFMPLKLGMYGDVTKFPYSGGYVWISECCTLFVSVFESSIFEGSAHVPNVIIKLMYHWACQTTVPNVIQWVKVDALYVKNVYALLRAVCTLAIQRNYGKLGGHGKKVQCGLLSLGTASQDGVLRLAKMDIVGAMEPDSKKIRLSALTLEHKTGRRRTSRAGQLLPAWIERDSVIQIDSTFDKEGIQRIGFTQVEQSPDGNKELMDYMRRVIPKLFQNTLNLLSMPLVQQFLDELVWRERWGPIAAHAFNNLMVALAELTREVTEEKVLDRLKAAALNPGTLLTQTAEYLSAATEAPKRGRKRLAEPELPPPSNKKSLRIPAPAAPSQATDSGRKDVDEHFWKVQPATNLSPEVIEFFNANVAVAVDLDSFYYGTLHGDDSRIIDRKPADLQSVKCCICLKPYLDNLSLMKHILLHCQTKPILTGPLRKINQCRHCFIGFQTAGALRSHVSEVHNPPASIKSLACLICEKVFADRAQLLYHMHRMHVTLELPYACQVCGHRSSSYNAIVEHISQAHQGGQHLFCPHCLKAVALFRNNCPLPGNVAFYVNHVQRHQRQLQAHCHRCRLAFVSNAFLQRHLERDHSSFSRNTDVRPFAVTSGVMMPEPGTLIKPALLPRLTEPVRKSGLYSVRHFPVPVKLDVDEDDDAACAECEAFLNSPDHFKGELECSKCKFRSCCEQAVAEHYSVYHDPSAPVAFRPGRPTSQCPTMHCPCGFYSSSANALAKHLVQCEQPTAYPSEGTARAALPKSSSKSTEGEEPNMLNMLGLVRKSPEPSADRILEAEEVSARFNELLQAKKQEKALPKQAKVEIEIQDEATDAPLAESDAPSAQLVENPGVEEKATESIENLASATESAADLAKENETESTEDPAPAEPSVETMKEPVIVESAAEPVEETVVESIGEPDMASNVEAAVENIGESAAEPVEETVVESIEEPAMASNVEESATEPMEEIAIPAVEDIEEDKREPVTERMEEVAIQSIEEPEVENTEEASMENVEENTSEPMEVDLEAKPEEVSSESPLEGIADGKIAVGGDSRGSTATTTNDPPAELDDDVSIKQPEGNPELVSSGRLAAEATADDGVPQTEAEPLASNLETSKEAATGSLIAELEDIMDTAGPTVEATDFISDLIDPQSSPADKKLDMEVVDI